jgi:hypothetical protein
VEKRGGDSSVVPMGGFCSSDGNADGESVNAIVHGKGEYIEAVKIRGMIELEVRLDSVQLLKVVVGVSLQGRSGILTLRLPDGTWWHRPPWVCTDLAWDCNLGWRSVTLCS